MATFSRDNKKMSLKKCLGHGYERCSFLEARLLYMSSDFEKDDARIESFSDPEIDSLLDTFDSRLKALRGEKERMKDLLAETNAALEVKEKSREDIQALLARMDSTEKMKKDIDATKAELEKAEAEIQDEEARIAFRIYKEKFNSDADAMLSEIFEVKAEIVFKALENFIENTPAYLDRLKADELLQNDPALKKAFTLNEEVKAGKLTLNDIQTRLKTAKERVEKITKQIEEKEAQKEEDARKLEEANIVSYLISDVLGPQYKTLIARDKNGEFDIEGSSLGKALELLITTQIESRLEGDVLKDGQIVKLQDIASHIGDSNISHEDVSGNMTDTFALLPDELKELNTQNTRYSEGLVKAISRTKKELRTLREERYNKREELNAYTYVETHHTEKEVAIASLARAKDSSDDVRRLIQSDFARAHSELDIKNAAYTALDADQALAAAALSTNYIPLSVSKKTPVENLLKDFDYFGKNEIPHESVVSKVSAINPQYAEDISYMIQSLGKKVHFVTQEKFDSFFDGNTTFKGQTMDNLRGGKGVYFDGRVVVVFNPENPDVEKMREVLAHETVHAKMHADSSTLETLYSELLYGGASRSEGLENAINGNTLGAQMIDAFMQAYNTDPNFGNFSEYAFDRTRLSGINSLRDVLENEELAQEVLEEIMTIYMTERAANKDVSSKRYLRLMDEFYNSTEGNKLLSAFNPLPHNREKVEVLGFTDAVGEPGAGDEMPDGTDKIPPTTPEQIEQEIEGAEKIVDDIQELMKELYDQDDYKDIVKNAHEDIGMFKGLSDEEKERAQQGEPLNAYYMKDLKDKISDFKKKLQNQVLDKLKEENVRRTKNPQNELNYAARLWHDTRFVALGDILNVFEEAWAYLKERREHRKARTSADLGVEMAPYEHMKSHFDGKVQSQQNKEVSEWKERYDGLEPDTILTNLRSAKDENQVKAIFEIMANEWGDFYFRKPIVIDALRRISGKKVVSYLQAKQVFDDIFGVNEADGLERMNTSSRNGKVSEAKSMGKEHANNLGKEWALMIQRHEDGSWVDSARFEGFLHYALENGKSYPRQVVWMIAKGYQLGILDQKVLVEMGGSGLIANTPMIEYLGAIVDDDEAGVKFRDGKTELDYIASLDLYNDDGKPTHQSDNASVGQRNDWIEFENWFTNYVPNKKSVAERREKLKSNTDKMDHDYIQDVWWDFNIGSYDSILNEQTGARQMVQDPAIANIYAQFNVNALMWDNGTLKDMFNKWMRTDQLLTEENYETTKGTNGKLKFVESGDGVERKKKNNRQVLKASTLDNTGAMFNSKMYRFRDITYNAYKKYVAKGDMEGARSYMLAGMIFFGEDTWINEGLIKTQYEDSGYNYARFESILENMKARAAQGFDPIPRAPQSHTIDYKGTSMKEDLRKANVDYRQGLS